MNKPVFSKEDFLLCDVPVPKGYPQSQTHAGIALYRGNYYLTTSPYPNKCYPRWLAYVRILLRKLTGNVFHRLGDGEYYENPCLYRGLKTGDDIPSRFEPLGSNPLVPAPKSQGGLPAYNSDPDLFIENGRAYILNRTVYRTKMTDAGYESRTEISLLEGDLFGGDSWNQRLLKRWDKSFVSPCLTKYDGKYRLAYLDTNSALDASTFGGLYIESADSLEGLSDTSDGSSVQVNAGDMLPWHLSLFQFQGELYSIIACGDKGDPTKKVWQMLGVFKNDLSELDVFPVPLTDYRSYRGSACITEDETFVLYSTTVWESIPGGKAVDGREVIVAKMPFSDLLDKARGI